MADQSGRPIDTGRIALRPIEDSDAWRAEGDARWSDWVALAQRIIAADALRRDLEGRGDAWDQGHAAGIADAAGQDTPNPYR
ncbi:hypothetical protein G5T42_02525 [Microbacterium sp. 4R-513]|uniref:hypothetical protein n=1 Tax=Microbacterium sp. 4R-513 TaxID=2567934 RepID=UPI0013E182EA|nr:hypothetical protein [Microbacterium sp. 4R-513]QIG38494.1 hypothetical protein G5T42_02525 [Microbacterium sp. 4R-513]